MKAQSDEPDTKEATDDHDCEAYLESYTRAATDLELLCAAYPEEIAVLHSSNSNIDIVSLHRIPNWFPLMFTLSLADCGFNNGASISMEFPKGYPDKMPLQIISYRLGGSNLRRKRFIEAVAAAVRKTAADALEYGEESGMSCCAAALDTWKRCCDSADTEKYGEASDVDDAVYCPSATAQQSDIDMFDDIHWITAEKTLVDRKSVFQAHLCTVRSDDMVRRAMKKLIEGSGKIQRATHNMVSWVPISLIIIWIKSLN